MAHLICGPASSFKHKAGTDWRRVVHSSRLAHVPQPSRPWPHHRRAQDGGRRLRHQTGQAFLRDPYRPIPISHSKKLCPHSGCKFPFLSRLPHRWFQAASLADGLRQQRFCAFTCCSTSRAAGRLHCSDSQDQSLRQTWQPFFFFY